MDKTYGKLILETIIELEIKEYEELLKTAKGKVKEILEKDLIVHCKLLDMLRKGTLFD